MSPGKAGTVRRHLLALDEILAQLTRHTGKDVREFVRAVDGHLGG